MDSYSSEFSARLTEMLTSYGLPPDMAAEIEAHLIPVTFEKAAVVFLRGTSADLLFWVLKGVVKLYLPRRDGDRTLVDLARPGDLLGFVNETDPKGRRQVLEAQALTRCSIGILSRENLAQLLRKIDHETAVRMLEQFNTAWSMLFARYVTFVGSSFRQRLEQVLYGLADRFGVNDERGVLLVPELSQEDLAEMIGCSRPMVSKLIADMNNEGLLMRGEKRRYILRARLEKPASIPRGNPETRVISNTGSKQAYSPFTPLSSTVPARAQGQGALARPRSGSYRSIV
ncbi:MAG TPA: Crp/Fnr family transcriptional regulator [Candidatus Binataceae bacterium]|nr:Crp/Fnr family transcriptional regulator [Candidatus Binataceae bacterium]